MKHHLTTILLLGALLLLWVWPLAATETDKKTVILKVHVPFVGG